MLFAEQHNKTPSEEGHDGAAKILEQRRWSGLRLLIFSGVPRVGTVGNSSFVGVKRCFLAKRFLLIEAGKMFFLFCFVFLTAGLFRAFTMLRGNESL